MLEPVLIDASQLVKVVRRRRRYALPACFAVLLAFLVAMLVLFSVSQLALAQRRVKLVSSPLLHRGVPHRQKSGNGVEQFKIEPLLNRKAPNVEINTKIIRAKVNAIRIVAILREVMKQRDPPVPTPTAWQSWDLHQNDCFVAVPKPSNHSQTEKGTSSTHPPPCPALPKNLGGRAFIHMNHSHAYTPQQVTEQNPELQEGGMWKPKKCTARHKVAIVIPYRDRRRHLVMLLSHLHAVLQRQNLHYRIYVVEQIGNDTFNKGVLMNSAFLEALMMEDWDCIVFHDVDLIPEDDRIMYSCPPQPRHLSVAVDSLGYRLPYKVLVGGVFAIQTQHFLRVNGYSNMYWGWGGEDDDMGYRVQQSGLVITRPPTKIARYTMLKHHKRRPLSWRVRHKLLRTSGRRYRLDGLNTLEYKLIHTSSCSLFTHFLVDVGHPPENVRRIERNAQKVSNNR